MSSKYKTKDQQKDGVMTLSELKNVVENFVSQRDWAKFHCPKNLAMAIGVEAGELMDLFRWHSESQSVEAMKRPKNRKAASDELADVIICTLSFANRTGIDIAGAVTAKVRKNARKYPIEKHKGRF